MEIFVDNTLGPYEAKGFKMSNICAGFTSSQRIFQNKDTLFSNCLERAWERITRLTLLSLNRSDCARMTTRCRQTQQEVQINSVNTIHISMLLTSDNIVWVIILYSRHHPNTVQVLQ